MIGCGHGLGHTFEPAIGAAGVAGDAAVIGRWPNHLWHWSLMARPTWPTWRFSVGPIIGGCMRGVGS